MALCAVNCTTAPIVHPKTFSPDPYRVTIRQTAFGIPHVKADDYGSLGLGAGYAVARENICLLADLYLSASAERSRFLGAGPREENVRSDFFYQRIRDLGWAKEPGLSPDVRAFMRGVAAGYNRYLRDTGVDALPDPSCRGASWVREISEIDVRRMSRINQFYVAFRALMVAAVPPPHTKAQAVVPVDWSPVAPGIGSNAIALGRDASSNGRGLFLANPHQPWSGSFRFFIQQLTIPGTLDVIGASPVSFPGAGIGHNEHVAWSATVSTARRFSFYRLDLVPGHPTNYEFDGKQHEMGQQEVTVQVRGEDGSLTPRTHTFYTTHFGATLIETGRAPLTWSEQYAWAVATVDTGWRSSEQSHQIQRAQSVREMREIVDRYQAWPVNLIAVDDSGEAFFADPGAIPRVTDELAKRCTVPGGLDGSRSDCLWESHPEAAAPGIFAPEELPHLMRLDYVANSNDSYWLSNPSEPLTGFPSSLGDETTARDLRTRIGIRMIEDQLSADGGKGNGLFDLDRLQQLMFANRHYGGELLRDELVVTCREDPMVTLEDNRVIDVSEACEVLANWDLKADLGSRGAVLFREFMDFGGARYRIPFDPNQPVDTPRGLASDDPEVRRALARAVVKLRDADLPLDVELGQVQFVERNGERIPIHGGRGKEGLFNVSYPPRNLGRENIPLRPGIGYPEIEDGSSFIMIMAFTDQGPISRALVTYSQSVNTQSPHYADQTRLYSRKQWVPMLYREADILADPELLVTELSQPRVSPSDLE